MAGLLVTLVGCTAGDGSGLDANGRPLGESSAIPLGPTLAALQVNVFNASCAVSGCHAGASAPLGLRLDSGFSYARLVGQSSVERPDLLRVAPGDPDKSYLMHKIEGSAAVGGRMPLNQPPLASDAVAAVRSWIAAGAPPTDSSAPRVVSTLPSNGGFSAALPAEIGVVLSRAIDAATLSAATVLLERSGIDRSFGDGNEVAISFASLQVDAATRTQFTIGLAGVPDVADVYRLRLVGTGVAPIRDADRVALDGNGDGNPGGDFLATFAVGDRFVGMQPTLASIQEAVFTPICTQCHYGTHPAGELNLQDGQSALTLIGVKRPFDPEIRVIAGEPANSFLIMKLEGTLPLLTQGERMPLGGPYLPPSTIAVMRAWIGGGAPP
jgi:hypothetical protein